MIKNNRYVRIDTKVVADSLTQVDFLNHLKYLKDISKERYFLGGGFKDEAGGMIVFEAVDLEEAHLICSEDPIIKSGQYTYDLKIWEIQIESE